MSNFSFSLPKYTLAMTQLQRDIKAGLEKHDKILGQIQSHPIVHGGVTRQVSTPETLETPLQLFEAKFSINWAVFIKTDTAGFAECLINFLGALFSQQKKYMFTVLSQTTEVAGNVVDAKGRNLWDACIEMMAQTEIRFDEYGNHNYKFYVHPDIGKKLAKTPLTPEQERKWEETMNAKREEYYAQKRTRRLS